MNYLGHYLFSNLPRIDDAKLFEQAEGMVIIVHYNRELPYQVNQISIMRCNESGKDSYDVFECLLFFDSDIKARGFGIDFAKMIIQARQNNDYTYTKLLGTIQL